MLQQFWVGIHIVGVHWDGLGDTFGYFHLVGFVDMEGYASIHVDGVDCMVWENCYDYFDSLFHFGAIGN